MANIGNIGRELDAVEVAFRRFTTAVEGPCMEDYGSDAEAYRTLRAAASELQAAAYLLMERIDAGLRAGSRR